MLSVEHLTVVYRGGHRAVDDVSFRVDDGEVVVLLGANGAGKTTTLNCCLDFVRPTAGRVIAGDIVVAERPLSAKRDIAYLPENVVLYPALSGRENLCYFARLDRVALGRGDAGDALVRAGVPAFALDRPVRTYSKGMRQKVGIAVAQVRRVRTVLLDEPTSGLDPIAARDLLVSIEALRERGCAVLVTTHDLPRAHRTADRILVMSRGRLVASWTGHELTDASVEDAYVRAMAEAS